MKTMMPRALATLALGAALLHAAPARADLQSDIAQARTQSPQAFRAVADVVAHAEEIDAKARVRGLPFTPRLKALGPNALFPMLELMAQGAPTPASLSPSARSALRVGLLEAIGSIRDERAVPVVEQVLTRERDEKIVRAAATSLSRIGSDAAFAAVASAARAAQQSEPASPRERAILAGLHDCRRAAAARLLTTRLTAGADDATTRVVLHSLGGVANAWAWRALSEKSELATTRSIASAALLSAFLAHRGDVREVAAKALLVVDDPATPVLLARARSNADADLAEPLDDLARRFHDNPARLAP